MSGVSLVNNFVNHNLYKEEEIMPGTISHLIVQQRLVSKLSKFSTHNENFLEGESCPYMGFGSMGPDFLFFSLKEYDTPLDELVNFTFKVYDNMEPLITFYEDNIEPVKEEIEDAIENLDELFFKGLFSRLKDTSELISSTFLETVSVVTVQNIDLFYPFKPMIQKGKDEKDWYWFDFLHYRRTGKFCSTMWEIAKSKSDKELMQYCVGYASHIGTDVVGHSYINAIVGGPYRTHWHRHKLVENWIDAYARNHYTDSSHTKNCLKLEDDDAYDENSISDSYYYRLCKFPDGKLPEKLGDMFLEAINKVYGDIPHPQNLTFKDLDTTYRLWLKWFERSTTLGSALKPTPVPPPGNVTQELINDYINGIPKLSGSDGGSNGFSIRGILAALFKFAKWILDVIQYTIEWTITHTSNILTLPYDEALNMINWLIYQIQKGIYELYDNLRFALVIGGYLFPEPRDCARTSLYSNSFSKKSLNSIHHYS